MWQKFVCFNFAGRAVEHGLMAYHMMCTLVTLQNVDTRQKETAKTNAKKKLLCTCWNVLRKTHCHIDYKYMQHSI